MAIDFLLCERMVKRMSDGKSVTIPLSAAVCAARHFVAAHESACRQRPVEWAAVCAKCPEIQTCKLTNGVIDWVETMKPIFEATGVSPQLCRP